MTDTSTLQGPIWMIGCGRMGGAIVDGWRAASMDLSVFTIVRPSGAAVGSIRTVQTAAEAGAPPNIVILAVKPQELGNVAPLLRQRLSSRTILISLLAGAETATLRSHFPGVAAIVRAMPNLPVSIRRGVVALFSDDANEAAKAQVANLFQPLGFAPWMVDEQRLAAVGALAGAGPAYVARFIAALAKAGETRGLSAEMASTVALETVFGTAWMAAGTGEVMDSIVRRVASPGGTTEAGLAVLDSDNVLDNLVAVTIEAAARRGAELGEETGVPRLAADERVH